ncbi:tRNA 2-thiouridine(34) synthase MnmA [Thermodesulfobacteriota bacterium]
MELKGKRVIVAMSGGVDSSLTAALLKDKGCEVIGVTLKLFDYERDECDVRKKSCCSTEDVYDARRVAEKIDIPFYVLDYKDLFKEYVIDNFVTEYLKGRTPNPCIICNEKIKFHYMLKQAEKLDADFLATGHYAINEYDEDAKLFRLKKGVDDNKDQSYFLFNLTQEQLKKIIFPLGGFTKDHVRELAKKYALKVADKVDSQEICFVTNNDYQSFIEKEVSKDTLRPGNIVNTSGNVLGPHKGIFAYTIGQRKGLGISHPTPLYVLGFDREKNEVIVGSDKELFKTEIELDNVTFISMDAPESELKVNVKIRYSHRSSAATLIMTGKDKARVTFSEPQRAITPGQAAVFYSDDEVVGGGWIER